MTNSFGINIGISTVPLDQVDYNGVGFLWMEAKHSSDNTPVSPSESKTVFHFLQVSSPPPPHLNPLLLYHVEWWKSPFTSW